MKSARAIHPSSHGAFVRFLGVMLLVLMVSDCVFQGYLSLRADKGARKASEELNRVESGKGEVPCCLFAFCF